MQFVNIAFWYWRAGSGFAHKTMDLLAIWHKSRKHKDTANLFVSASSYFCHYLLKSFSCCTGVVSNFYHKYSLLCDRDCVKCSSCYHLNFTTSLWGRYHFYACFTQAEMEAGGFVHNITNFKQQGWDFYPYHMTPRHTLSILRIFPRGQRLWQSSVILGCTTWGHGMISPVASTFP